MADIGSCMREVAEASRAEAAAPGADAAWRRGRRRRRTAVAGGVVSLTLALAAASTVSLESLRDNSRPVAGGTTAIPDNRSSRSLPCPRGPVACGESQGIRWQVRLVERGSDKLFGQDVSLALWVGRQGVGRLSSPLPTSGNFEAGRAFDSPQGRMRAVLGILTPGASGLEDLGRAARFRVRYGDAGGTPTGAAEAVAIPVGVLHARIWVGFIPADAWLVDIDGLDAQGNPLAHRRTSSCSTPPKLPLPACQRGRLPATVRS